METPVLPELPSLALVIGVIQVTAASELLGEPGLGEVLLRPTQGGAGTALARQVWQQGRGALPQGDGPLRRVRLPPGPSLDDLLAGYLVAGSISHAGLDAGPGAGMWPPQIGLLCDYAAEVREGILPGTVVPERSLAGIYQAIVELNRAEPQRIVTRGLLFLEAAIRHLCAGRSIHHEDIFSNDERFSRELAYLAQDRQRYLRDRQAGQRFAVRLGHLGGHLLALRQPSSILFRLFAFHDREITHGGFDLVLVERAGEPVGDRQRRHVALFADPIRRLPLRDVLLPLCVELNRLEAGAGQPACEPWYDGRCHHYQRLASPRIGTAIPARQLTRVLHEALHMTRPRGAAAAAGWVAFASGRPWSHAGAGALAVALIGMVLLVARVPSVLPLFHLSPSDTPRIAMDSSDPNLPVARGDWQLHRLPQGPPLSATERETVVSDRVRNYALIVAAGAYAPRGQGGLGPLRTPWRDACALRELLVRRFGYRRQDIVTLADSPCLRDVAGAPSREKILWTLEHLPTRRDDSLLFYYAGHGAIEDEAGGRYGYLQPGGWEAPRMSREDRGLRMRTLAELLRDKVAARHQLLLIDACHSGETAIVRGGDSDAIDRLDAPVRAGWRERPVYAVITASRSVDLALEERLIDSPYPHSLFMRALLEGLSYAPTGSGGACQLRADADPRLHPDGLITDGELFKYLARRLPELRAPIEVPGLPADDQGQVPEWNPWAAQPRPGDGARRIGEFMLAPRDVTARAGARGGAQADGKPNEGPTCPDQVDPEPEVCRPEACSP